MSPLEIKSTTSSWRRGGLRNNVRYSSIVCSAKESDNGDNEKIKVAVIGGGIAGLSCASHLTKSGLFEPTVFDTGRLRPGGRCSSRLPGDAPKDKKASRDRILDGVVVDHAAQILTVPSSSAKSGKFDEFAEQVKVWEEKGIIRRFPPNSVCEILTDKKKMEKEGANHDGEDGGIPFWTRPLNGEGGKQNTSVMYYGVNGMGSIPAAIAMPSDDGDGSLAVKQQTAFLVEQDVWISPNNGVKFIGNDSGIPKWTVQTNGKKFGSFDRIVIAHNGKCADRLMSRTPAKKLHSLLQTNFSPTVPAWGGKRMTLNSIYSLTIAIPKDGSPLTKALGDDLICAFVKNEPTLRFITCQTRKDHDSVQQMNKSFEVWTVLSSSKFAKKYKAPQENIPMERVEEVTGMMVSALERSLNLKEGVINDKVADSRLQLWGAAVPINTWDTSKAPNGGQDGDARSKSKKESDSENKNEGFIYDAQYGVGACGDWLFDPSIGGAWESGRRLSNWITLSEKERKTNDDLEKLSVGLPPNGSFRASKAASDAAIGNIK